MKRILWLAMLVTTSAASVQAVEFLGVELCVGSVDTSVVLPVGSALALESTEIGRHGGLLLLLAAADGEVMDHIDELMAEATGVRGTGDAKKLQWVGNQITAYAQLIKDGYAALAVSTTDPCDGSEDLSPAEAQPSAKGDEVAPVSEAPPPAASAPRREQSELAGDKPPVAVTETEVERPPATTAAPDPDVATAPSVEDETFVLSGRLKHTAAEDGWVDVMGVVVNRSGEGYAVASFDLSLWNAAGELICVDTISINRLSDGQQRAFRAALRCPDYDGDAVASWKLQFAGGH